MYICGQDFDSLVPTYEWPSDDPGIRTRTTSKPYILEPLGNTKLSRSQYFDTLIINYGPNIDNMFALRNFAHVFFRKLY